LPHGPVREADLSANRSFTPFDPQVPYASHYFVCVVKVKAMVAPRERIDLPSRSEQRHHFGADDFDLARPEHVTIAFVQEPSAKA
jgi:hypothetical protein